MKERVNRFFLRPIASFRSGGEPIVNGERSTPSRTASTGRLLCHRTFAVRTASILIFLTDAHETCARKMVRIRSSGPNRDRVYRMRKEPHLSETDARPDS